MMLMSKSKFLLSQLFSRIWVKITAFSLLAILTSLAAIAIRPHLPPTISWEIGAKSVEPILNIIASSMLAVSTFSLGIMANAMASAAQSTTPRATQLLLEDKTSQNVLTTFLGSFVFALVSIISIHIGIYDQGGRIVLLVTTIFILVIVFSAFIRWISLLRVFGRIPDTLDRIENATLKSIEKWQQDPLLGCEQIEPARLKQSQWTDVFAANTLHVQHIDLSALNAFAQKLELKLIINAQPGTLATPNKPLVRINKDIEEEHLEEIRQAFSLANERTFKQDPELGFIVLAETASRALSFALNDPGTAIDIVYRGLRLFQILSNEPQSEIIYQNLLIEPLSIDKMLSSFYLPIIRDGKNIIELQHALVTSYAGLLKHDNGFFHKSLQNLIKSHMAHIKNSDLLDAEKDQLQDQFLAL